MNEIIHTAGPLQAVGLWTALCILFLLILSALTSVARRKHRVSVGDGGHHEVSLASRAFGNAAEYVPIALVALVLLALTGFPAWSIHAVGAAFFFGRVLHAQGMRATQPNGAPTPGRMIGMALTYLPLTAAAAALIWRYVFAAGH